MVQEPAPENDLLREARKGELALIEAETRAEETLLIAEERYREALEKLRRAQERANTRRQEYQQARARLDQCQLERAAGPVLHRTTVPRPVLPRPARDDSRGRTRTTKRNEPVSKDTGSSEPNSD